MSVEDTLSVGDIVCLYSSKSYGYVFGSQSSTVHNEVAVGARQDRLKPDVQDQHVISFEICVANRYKLNKKYRSLKAKLDEDQENLHLRTTTVQAQIAAKAENDDNDLEQKRQQGKKVQYGQIIQLRHVFTGKYIHVSTTQTSPTESSNMAVELLPDNAKHAQFKIMPRYKVKAEGDVVQIDDQIVLESVKSAGQFFHVSQGQLGKASVYSKSHELNLSVQQSGFTVYRKYKPMPSDENIIKVGDLIRFYHKEMEAYLVAEGLFDDELTEDVHLRMRPVDQSNPKTLFPSSSAVTYWQVELQEGPISGGLLKWEQQCRIIHMCTRKYLTVDETGKVTLTSDHLDPRTVFRLHPVIRESDDIPYESYCRMEHVVTGNWLHAFTDEYKRKQEVASEDTQSMSSLKWSTASLKKGNTSIGVIEEKQYDDAFTIQAVEGNLVEIFNYMAGMVPFIQKLLSDKKAGEMLNAKMTHDTIMALSEMKEFMIENSVPSKRRQKLMRNLRIVELLVSLLRVPFRGSADQIHLTKIFVEAYDVLYTYLMGDSRKNELYIAKYIDFFLPQFEYKEGMIGLNAAHMVMELIRDNRKIVDRITHAHIDQFVDLLRRDKNYRYLDLLSVLCVCDGVSIADNQQYITEVWLMKGNRNCVFYTDLGQKIGKKPGIVYVSTNAHRSHWMELNDFASSYRREQKKSENDEEYLFLEHQLELFGYLCHGQNDFSIKVITKELEYLTWEEAFTCLSDDRLPDRLRAKYCDLIITMFVDIGDNISVVDKVKLSYIYEDVDQLEQGTEKDVVDRTKSPTYQYFPSLSEWISKFLGSNGDMTASEIGNNMLVQQVLRLVHHLVSFGFYYKSTDIKKLLEPLMSLLDGRNDKPYPKIIGKEGQEVLAHFRTKERFEPSPETKAIVDAKCQALDVLNLFFNYIFNLRLEKFMNLFKITHTQSIKPGGKKQANELAALLHTEYDLGEDPGQNFAISSAAKASMRKLKEIFDETAFLRNYEVVEILKDLSHYQYDEMVRNSMHLLNRYFSAHRNLFNRAVQAQVLITDKSVDIVTNLENLLPALRRLASAKLGQDQTEELVNLLNTLIGMCHLEGETEDAHCMNQSILYNNGVLEDAFTILSQEIDVKLLKQYTGQRQIFQKTFTLLKMLARGNKVIQGRLFDRLDMLLSKEGAPAELAEALTEVFTGNSNTCMKIMAHQVQKIMSLVAEHRTDVPQFLDLLNAVVKVEELDLPLKRNQGYVMTYFMQYRADVAFLIDADEKEREKVLVSANSKDLNYMIAMVDLLATCAEGENRFIESICQTIFKIPDLLRVLNNPNVNDNLKRPFLRFFLWVYLNTASGMIESGAGDVPHDKSMWGYLTGLNGILQKLTDFTRAEPETVKRLLKRPPGKSGGENSQSDRASSHEEGIRGSLHYMFDGVMPFLQVFCRSYYQPDTSVFPQEPEDLDSLAKSFQKFFEVLSPHVSIEQQMKNLVACMSKLLSVSTLPTDIMEEFQNKYSDFKAEGIKSGAKKKYEDYYQGEEEINAQLNVFANNVLVAYGGVNDVQTQTGFPSTEPYTEVGGDEDLPLGEEFQDHLKCFINPQAKKSTDKYALAQKLIMQLAISTKLTNLGEKERLEQLDLDIKCLQLLRGLIHNEIVKLSGDWESDPKSSARQLYVIEQVQNALNSYDVVEGVLDHLDRPQDSIVRELLAFLNVLLFNGNEKVQDSMIGMFTGTREETFFFAIKSRMNLSAIATREKRVLHAMHQAKIDEAVAQAKSLQKAMKTGKLAADQIMKANKLGSVLTMAKKSMVSVRPQSRAGNALRPGSGLGMRPKSGLRPVSRGPQLKGSQRSIRMGVPPRGHAGSAARLRPNAKQSKTSMSSRATTSKAQVAPQADVEINIETIDQEELEELIAANTVETVDLDFKDDGYIELVLRLLGLMCDNLHNGLQDYLREQPDNIKSVNLVAETTRFLNILYSNVNTQSISLVIQLFDTLVEFCGGNTLNQATVFDNKICDYINHILRVGRFKGCEPEEVLHLKMSIATLIRALTEENPIEEEDESKAQVNLAKDDFIKRTRPTCMEVMEYLDTDTLLSTMSDTYQKLTAKPQDKNSKVNDGYEDLEDELTEVGFAYYHILCRKCDLHENITKQTILKTPDHETAWDYFEESTLSIEILKDDSLQKVYFRVSDKKVLREEIKEKYKYEVDRSSPSNKLRDFMDWSIDIIKDIKYQRRVHSNPIGRLLTKLWAPMNYLVLVLSFAICLLVMITWEDPKNADLSSQIGNPVPTYHANFPGAMIATYVMGGIHNFLCLCIFISYVISNRPTFPRFGNIRKAFRKEQSEEEEHLKSWNDKTGESHLEVKAIGFKTIYYLIFLACSALGTAFYGYFFAFHLLHMVELNQMLKRVTKAVTTNGRSLLMVGLLGLAIFYIYSLIVFAFYREWFWKETEGRQCRTMYQCFVSVLHHGLVEGPYTQFESKMDNDFTVAIGIMVFDVSFFILVTTIGLNIIFGIIVDTFSQLRDSKWEIDKDMQTICFVCSRESYDFERQGGGFEHHVKKEHNQWAYLFFFIHLDETRPNDYSALEHYVYTLLMRNNYDFFPMNKALCLKNEKDDSGQKELQQQVDFIVTKMKEEEAAREREKERQRQKEWESKHKKKSKHEKS